MIYLIDDKKERQKNLGWIADTFKVHADVLIPIYTNFELQKIKKSIFLENNVILFHESFFDNKINSHSKDSLQIRSDIKLFSHSILNAKVVFFSGSIGERIIEGNTAHIPVEVLYKNLNEFCNSYKKNSQDLLKIIAFGTYNIKEEIMLIKIEIWELLYDTNDDDVIDVTYKLSQLLEKIELKSNKVLSRIGITNGFLKYQIKNI